MQPRYCRPVVWKRISSASRLSAGNIVGALYHKRNTQSNAPEDGQNNLPKHAELNGIINQPLLLHLVGCLHNLYIIYYESFHVSVHKNMHSFPKKLQSLVVCRKPAEYKTLPRSNSWINYTQTMRVAWRPAAGFCEKGEVLD